MQAYLEDAFYDAPKGDDELPSIRQWKLTTKLFVAKGEAWVRALVDRESARLEYVK